MNNHIKSKSDLYNKYVHLINETYEPQTGENIKDTKSNVNNEVRGIKKELLASVIDGTNKLNKNVI